MNSTPSIRQLHSIAYHLTRSAASWSGARGRRLAFRHGRRLRGRRRPTTVTLCGPDRGEIPVPARARGGQVVLPLMLIRLQACAQPRRTPMGRKDDGRGALPRRAQPAGQGERPRRPRRGAARRPGSTGRRPTADRCFDDGTGHRRRQRHLVHRASSRSSTGSSCRSSTTDGWPVEYRGVVDEAPGLYFCGLSFQYAFSSMILPGVGRDAEFVADADHRPDGHWRARQVLADPALGASTAR